MKGNVKFIKKAVRILGSQGKLAEAIRKSCGTKTTQSHVHAWINLHKSIQPEVAIQIEIATKGEVTAKQLRPDIFNWEGIGKPEHEEKTIPGAVASSSQCACRSEHQNQL